MKHVFTAAISFLFMHLAFGQDGILFEEGVKPFSKGSFNSFQVTIPQAKTSDVQKDWQKYLKEGAKNKPIEVNGEIIMVGAVKSNISPKPFNVYSKLLETTKGVIVTAWFTDNDTMFYAMDSSDRELAVQKYLHDFAAQEYRDVVKQELSKEKDKLKKLTGELDDLVKKEEKCNKNINGDERDIKRNEDVIKVNENDQANKQNQIADQKLVVESLKGNPGSTLDAAQKQLKDYQNELKKLVNENEKLHKGNDKLNADIRAEQRNIEDLKRQQQAKSGEIDKQAAVVKGVQDKLDAIK